MSSGVLKQALWLHHHWFDMGLCTGSFHRYAATAKLHGRMLPSLLGLGVYGRYNAIVTGQVWGGELGWGDC